MLEESRESCGRASATPAGFTLPSTIVLRLLRDTRTSSSSWVLPKVVHSECPLLVVSTAQVLLQP